jgi:hypothetical protein
VRAHPESARTALPALPAPAPPCTAPHLTPLHHTTRARRGRRDRACHAPAARGGRTAHARARARRWRRRAAALHRIATNPVVATAAAEPAPALPPRPARRGPAALTPTDTALPACPSTPSANSPPAPQIVPNLPTFPSPDFAGPEGPLRALHALHARTRCPRRRGPPTCFEARPQRSRGARPRQRHGPPPRAGGPAPGGARAQALYGPRTAPRIGPRLAAPRPAQAALTPPPPRPFGRRPARTAGCTAPRPPVALFAPQDSSPLGGCAAAAAARPHWPLHTPALATRPARRAARPPVRVRRGGSRMQSASQGALGHRWLPSGARGAGRRHRRQRGARGRVAARRRARAPTARPPAPSPEQGWGARGVGGAKRR